MLRTRKEDIKMMVLIRAIRVQYMDKIIIVVQNIIWKFSQSLKLIRQFPNQSPLKKIRQIRQKNPLKKVRKSAKVKKISKSVRQFPQRRRGGGYHALAH